MINKEFHRIRLNYYNAVLDTLPTGNVRVHHGRQVIRLYQHDGKENEYYYTSKNGQKALKLIEEKAKYLKLKAKYEALWLKTYKEPFSYDETYKIPTGNYVMAIPIKRWNDLIYHTKPESEKDLREYTYSHNNIKMRSRFEIITAEVLDELDIEFLYEVHFTINNKNYYADFIIKVPELGCCFVIECLGMMDNLKYRNDTINKLKNYTFKNLLFGKDLILISGTEKHIPDAKNISSLIAGQLEANCYTLIK